MIYVFKCWLSVNCLVVPTEEAKRLVRSLLCKEVQERGWIGLQ